MGPGIYILSGISPLSSKVGDYGYFGLSVHPEKRLDQHLRELHKGTHKNQQIQDFYNNYGKDKLYYDIVEECDIDQLAQREIKRIEEGKTFVNPEGFNLTKGGEGVGAHAGKLFSFEDTRYGITITGQNIAMFQRANPQFEILQLYRLSRGEISEYNGLTCGPANQ